MKMKQLIALGTWSQDSGVAGGDQVFRNHLDIENLQSVFDAANHAGLNLWDTAAVYGMGAGIQYLSGMFDTILQSNFRYSGRER